MEKKETSGSVKFFKQIDGWGFITGEDGAEYFVHVANIADGKKILYRGERVSFQTLESERGKMAVEVRTQRE